MLAPVLWWNALPHHCAPLADSPLALIFRGNGPTNFAGAALPPYLDEGILPSLANLNLGGGDWPAIGALLGYTEGKPVG
jgi:hypothetical protein